MGESSDVAAGDQVIDDDHNDLRTDAIEQQIAIPFVIGDGVNTIETGIAGSVMLPAHEIELTSWYLLSEETGSIVIDIWKDTHANAPPTNADTITGGNEISVTGAQKGSDTSPLESWTTTLAALSWLTASVDSISTFTQVTLMLIGYKTK